MQSLLQITARNVQLAEAEEQMIRRAAGKLDLFWDRITSCRVLIEVPHRRHRTGMSYNVRLDLGVPGAELAVTRRPRASLETAVQEAFDAAQRRLQDEARRTQGRVKLDRNAPRGTVTRLLPFEGYGFITAEDGHEIHFDRASVLDAGFDRLEEGMEVRYHEEAGEKGPQASTVAIGAQRRRQRARRVAP
jgi:cold shock CspA family protein